MGTKLRRALLDIAIFAMLLHALLPAGWMPGPASDGAISFVICSASGLHHLDGRDGHQDKGEHQNDACPFAAAPHAATPVLVTAIAPPSRAFFGRSVFAAILPAPQRAAYLPQAQRAPPISA